MGYGAFRPDCMIVTGAFAILPANVAVLKKLVAEGGLKEEVNWQVPPVATPMVVEVRVQFDEGVRVREKLI